MAYSTRRHIGGEITSFWPDDTPTEFYLSYEASIEDILEKIKEKFGPTASLEDITINPEYIHTDCLYYDCYDSGDYTNFLHITWNKPKEENISE